MWGRGEKEEIERDRGGKVERGEKEEKQVKEEITIEEIDKGNDEMAKKLFTSFLNLN